MAPNVALDLSPDGIRVLHRRGGAWVLIGAAMPDAPDLDEILRRLRQAAETREPGGLTVEVVIPPAQILYATVEAPAPRRSAKVEAAIAALTSLPAGELAWDYRPAAEDRARVAVIERRTLHEAEAFAAGHGFPPAVFTAWPAAADFPGVPVFATVAAAAAGRPKRAERGPEPAGPDEPTIGPDSAPVIGAATLPASAMTESRPVRAADTAISDPESDAPPAAAESGQPIAGQDEALPTAPKATPVREAARPPGPAADPDEPPTAADGPAPDTTAPAAAASTAEGDALRSAQLSRLNGTPASGPRLAELPAFRSRHHGKPGPGRLSEMEGRIGFGPAESRKPPDAAAARLPDAPTARTPPPNRPTTAGGAPTPEPLRAGQPPSATESAEPRPQPPKLAATGRLSEAEALTRFGARAEKRTAPRRWPVVLLALAALAAVLLWVFPLYLLTDPTAPVATEPGAEAPAPDGTLPPAEVDVPGAPPGALPATPAPEAPATLAPPPSAAPRQSIAPAPRAASPEPEGAAPAGETPADAPEDAEAAAPAEPLPDAPLAETPLPETSLPDAPAVIAALPPAELAPPSVMPTPTPEATAAPPVAPPPALSEPGSEMVAPEERLPPPPAGTEYELDERGLVRATPEGALTGEGILVRATPPPVRPPERPERPAGTPEATESGGLEAAPPEPVSGAAVTGSTPGEAQAAPETEVTPDAEALSETGAAEGEKATEEETVAEPQLAAAEPGVRVRPEPRPVRPAELPAPEGALAASRLPPPPRPADFAALAASVRARNDAPADAPAAATVRSLPTQANVAEQATASDTINLRRMNLIGVFGAPSDRRALVRLPGGEFVRLKVGDRLDGGRVAAIGQSELRYVKGGQSHVLQMPQT